MTGVAVRYTPRARLAVCLAGLWLSAAQAADPPLTEADFLEDLPVVLSATRLSQPVEEAPAAVTVIDQAMIRASGFRDIPDLMRLVPGFSVAYTRFNTWAMGYHGLGDAFSRRLQVLVDGRSIYSAHYGEVNWGDLPLAIDDIERIEVIRGPNAAIHGSNAFAAVINIITKTAAQVPGTFLSAQAGNKSMGGLTVRHGGGQGDVRYRFTLSAQERDRFEREVDFKPPGSLENGEYFEATKTYFANGRIDWQLDAQSDLSVQFGLTRGDWKAGRANGNPLEVLEPRKQDVGAHYLQMSYRMVESPAREWLVTAYHSRNIFDADAQLFVPGLGTLVVDQLIDQTRSNLELQVNEVWSDTLKGVWGMEVRHETVKSPQSYPGRGRLDGTLARAYGHAEWAISPGVLLQGGAMLERHYFTGYDLSPRLAASFTLAPGHTLRLGASQAYRAPTFYERESMAIFPLDDGTVLDILTVPAPGLEPERIRSLELAWLARVPSARLEWDVRLFTDRITRFIDAGTGDFIPGDLLADEVQFANQGSIRSRGGEVQLRWRPTADFDLTAHYARVFLNARLDPGSFNAGFVNTSAPRNSGALLAIYRFVPGWEASLGAYYWDKTRWLSEGGLVDGHTRVDVRLARRWRWQGSDVEAALVGQNLGKNYAEFIDTNQFSRRAYFSLSMTW